MGTQSVEIICLKELKKSNSYACGLKNGGVSFFDINFEKNRLAKYARYLDNLTVKDIFEIDKNLVLIQG